MSAQLVCVFPHRGSYRVDSRLDALLAAMGEDRLEVPSHLPLRWCPRPLDRLIFLPPLHEPQQASTLLPAPPPD